MLTHKLKSYQQKNMRREEKAVMEPASPTARLLQQPGFDLCILAVMGFQTTIDAVVFTQAIDQTLVRHPRFSSLLVPKRGRFHWERVRVDVKSHVIVPDLDPGMDSPDQFVEDYIAGLSMKQLEKGKPLWEAHVLNVKTSDAKSTVIFKIDHSMGDGVSLISVLLACSKKVCDPQSLPDMPGKKHKKLGSSEKIKNNSNGAMKRWLMVVWTIILVCYYTLIDCAVMVATMIFLKDSTSPIKGSTGVEVTPKRFVHRVLSLDDVKLIKTAMNVSINDVIMGVTEAGLSRYLNARCDKSGPKSVPKNIRFRSASFFNLRPSPSIEVLADIMENGKEINGLWGNIVGLVLIPFSVTRVEDDPLTYIRRANATMQRKKLSLAPKCVFVVLNVIIKLFGLKVAAHLTSTILYNTTFGFSNVVGPQEEISFLGHELAYISPTVFGYPQALLFHYQSYSNKVIVAVAADQNLIPNPHDLCHHLHNSLQSIKDAVVKKGLVIST